MTKLITKTQIQNNYDMQEIIREVESAYKQLGEGKVTMPDRVFMDTQNEGDVLFAPAFLKDSGYFGLKASSFTPTNGERNLALVNGVYILFKAEDGLIEAIIDSELITALRTGAKSAVAVKYLVREDSKILGILGMGKQAFTQIEAISKVVKLEKILMWSREPNKHTKLVDFVKNDLGLACEVIADPDMIAEQSDILIDATYATEPLVQTKSIKPGTLVIGINHSPKAQEFPAELLAKSKVYVDYKQNLHAGTLSLAIEKGLIKSEQVIELSKLVVEGKKYAVKDNEFTYFQSGGVSIEDLAAAVALYKRLGSKAKEFKF